MNVPCCSYCGATDCPLTYVPNSEGLVLLICDGCNDEEFEGSAA